MSYVLRGARVFDGSGSDPFDADVIVDDEHIAALGASPAVDQEIDVTGLTVLPGLIDCHVHVMSTSLDASRERETPFSLKYFEAARNLALTLRSGFTTVRDAGGADLGVKAAIEAGLIEGPDMQLSITALSQTGGHGDHWSVNGAGGELFVPHPGRPTGIVDGPDEMRVRVRQLLRAGAGVIKVCASGGVISPRSSPMIGEFSLGELEVCVQEASRAGVAVMAHAHSPSGIKTAVLAGVRSIEHGVFADDECFALMRDRGVWLVPTLVAPHGVLAAAAAGSSVSPVVVSKAKAVAEAHRDTVSRAVRAGVKIALGTDAGVVAHGTNARELALMVECGMTPAQALVAATSSAAALLGFDDRGAIQPGLLADLVIVDGDPYDVRNLAQQVRYVVKRGRFVGHGNRAD